MAFYGDVPERRLMKIFKSRVGVVLHVICMVLLGVYLGGNGCYRVNFDVALMFVVMLLDVGR